MNVWRSTISDEVSLEPFIFYLQLIVQQPTTSTAPQASATTGGGSQIVQTQDGQTIIYQPIQTPTTNATATTSQDGSGKIKIWHLKMLGKHLSPTLLQDFKKVKR